MKRIFLILAAMIIAVSMMAVNVFAGDAILVTFDDETLGDSEAFGLQNKNEPLLIEDGKGGYYLQWRNDGTDKNDGMLNFNANPAEYFTNQFVFEYKVMIGSEIIIPKSKLAFEQQMKYVEGWTGRYCVVSIVGKDDTTLTLCNRVDGTIAKTDIEYDKWYTIAAAFDIGADVITVYLDGVEVFTETIGFSTGKVSACAYSFIGMPDQVSHGFVLNIDDVKVYTGESPADWEKAYAEAQGEDTEATTTVVEEQTTNEKGGASEETKATTDNTGKTDDTSSASFPIWIIPVAVAAVAVIVAVVVVIKKKK